MPNPQTLQLWRRNLDPHLPPIPRESSSITVAPSLYPILFGHQLRQRLPNRLKSLESQMLSRKGF